MREEVPNAHLVTLSGIVRQVLRHRVVEADQTCLHQLHDRGGRELLRERPDPIHGLCCHRYAVLDVRVSVALHQEQISATLHADGQACNRPITERRLSKRVDPGNQRSSPYGVLRRRTGWEAREKTGQDGDMNDRSRSHLTHGLSRWGAVGSVCSLTLRCSQLRGSAAGP